MSNCKGWNRVLATNLLGALDGVQTFVPVMADCGTPGPVINAGSHQGISTTSGDTACKDSKAGIIVLSERLVPTLPNKVGYRVISHLLIPHFTYTRMMSRRGPEKPASAWYRTVGKAPDLGDPGRQWTISRHRYTRSRRDHRPIQRAAICPCP
jgi:NAD(P)-dependent dehydrogenase (short-subunit alcohol dehydrogenase family)